MIIRIIYRFFALTLLLLAATQGWAQAGGAEEDRSGPMDSTLLYLKAYAYGDTIDLKWIPLDPRRWDQAMAQGYQVRRRTLRDDGSPDPATEVTLAGSTPANRIRPQDSLWFAQNADLEPDSLLASVGRALYDPALNAGPQGSDNVVERYKFVLFCAEQSADVYYSIGGFLRDSTVESGKSYEYTIVSEDGSGRRITSAVISILSQNGEYEQVPYGFFPNPGLAGENSGGFDNMNYTLNQIILSAKAYGDSIVLRWAPNNPVFWRDINEIGYFLLRVGYDVDNARIDSTDKKVFVDPSGQKFIMPWDSTRFRQNRNETDEMVMVAAQVLYGETFNLPEGNFLKQGSDLENRYAFALLAAERSPRAADALGLRLVDRDVVPGKTYRYQIGTVIDTFALAHYTLFVTNERQPGEKPYLFTAEPGDHAITLKWDKNFNRRLFSTYRLERSDDGGRTYTPLTTNLLLLDDEDYEDYTYVLTDSVPENYKTYYYRLSGLNSFAEWSPPAELRAMARDLTPPPNPVILPPEQTGDGSVRLSWTMPEEPGDLKGYQVLLGSEDEGLFEPVTDQPLPPGTREYVYTVDAFRTDTAYYFEIAAIDTSGNQSESFPVFLNIVDSIPPAAPVNLKGIIDTAGIVTLVWEIGTEPDLEGYRVFFSNDTTYEFTQLTVSPVEYNFFLDTIEVQTLTEEIYYMVQAVDVRFNRSGFSDVLALKRPDFLPPVTPVFRQPEITPDSIVLRWAPSVSEDVEQHLLYRRKYESEEEWAVLATLGPADSLYTDKEAEVEQIYEYTLRALDDAGLYSDYAFPVKGRRWFADELLLVSGLTATYNPEAKAVQVQWQYAPPAAGPLARMDFRFYLYRAVNEEPLERYRQLNGGSRSFADTAVKTNEAVSYAIKVVFRNGKTSPVSEIVRVTPTE